MYGLSVRWSLAGTGAELAASLRTYVVEESLARFAGKEGLHFKTWRMRPGEWFEGTYVFATRQARDAFLESFREQAATAPGTKLIGRPPEAMEPFEVVAVAEGAAGFASGGGPGSF